MSLFLCRLSATPALYPQLLFGARLREEVGLRGEVSLPPLGYRNNCNLSQVVFINPVSVAATSEEVGTC